MKKSMEYEEYNHVIAESSEGAPMESSEEWFSIPDETSCSAEFPDGCIFREF